MEIRITPIKAFVAGVFLVMAAALVIALTGGPQESDNNATAASDTAKAQTVSFQKPEDPGPDPFTEPTDVEGSKRVNVSSGSGTGDSQQPFGGSGSNKVCDRDKLIRFLHAHPDRMREWARVLGVHPTFRAVKKYI